MREILSNPSRCPSSGSSSRRAVAFHSPTAQVQCQCHWWPSASALAPARIIGEQHPDVGCDRQMQVRSCRHYTLLARERTISRLQRSDA